MFQNIIKEILKKIFKTFKSRKGNSLAEFAVTTAMMATLIQLIMVLPKYW